MISTMAALMGCGKDGRSVHCVTTTKMAPVDNGGDKVGRQLQMMEAALGCSEDNGYVYWLATRLQRQQQLHWVEPRWVELMTAAALDGFW